jgi:ubiquinone/menaquinone biosynthesis C-methylase UbiE
MAEMQIRFDDGAAYELMMGAWSRIAGKTFVDWLAPHAAMRWIDIGCGNGAFTELIVERCAPAAVQGIEPSEGQLAYARKRLDASVAKFTQADATSLPFSSGSFDAAIMALVIFFVPDPPKGVSEMARVVRPGGTVAAYAWDMVGGGFPLEPVLAEMRAANLPTLRPPRFEVSRIEALRDLWTDAGLVDVETREIAVQREFADFDEYWRVSTLGSHIGPTIADMSPADAAALKERVRERLNADRQGRFIHGALANAVKGRVPA